MKSKKIIKNIFYFLLFPSIFLNIFLTIKNHNLLKETNVSSVIDGDTFILVSGQKVRLLGINSPELDLCGGEEAKKKLEELVLNKNVVLTDKFYDKYGRVVALVYMGDTLINEILLKEGWARSDSATNSREAILKQATQEAQKLKKGIFSNLCRKEVPEDPKCLIKGNFDKISGDKRYHFPGCREYNTTIVEKDLGDKWFCTEKDALAEGYTKAQNCYDKKYK